MHQMTGFPGTRSYERNIFSPFVQRPLDTFGARGNQEEQLLIDVATTKNIAAIGSNEAFAAAGMLATDIAAREVLDHDLREGWFAYSESLFSKVDPLTKEPSNIDNVKFIASLGLASLDLRRSLHIDGQIPGEADARTYRGSLEALALTSLNLLWQRSNMPNASQRDMVEYCHLSGQLAELTVLLLLQRRFATMPEGTILALKSLFTEDDSNSEVHVQDKSRSWDVSVMTQLGEQEPDLTYKLQVKNGDLPETRRAYADDIVIVVLENDLLVTKAERKIKHISAHTILRELVAEVSSRAKDKALAARLDQRSEILLDLLDA